MGKAYCSQISGCSILCACGRELANGTVRVTGGLVPIRRTPLAAKQWAARQNTISARSADGDFVVIRQEEFRDLLQMHLSVDAWGAVLSSLREQAKEETPSSPSPPAPTR